MGCNSSKDIFKDYQYKNTKTFSFENKKLFGKVIKVYDGDTIWIVCKIFDNIYKIKIRLNELDTPELKSKDEKEKEKAELARDYLYNLIYNKYVYIECGKFDKYGRVLGDIIYNGKNINKLMIEKGYGVYYNGGKKSKFI